MKKPIMNLKGVHWTKVYLDILFLANFIMDMCLLVLAGRLLNIKSPLKRIICAAAFGALSDCILICTDLNVYLKIIVENIMIPAGIMAVWLYGNTALNVKFMLKYILIWYFLAFAAGGFIEYIFGNSVSIYELSACALLIGAVSCIVSRSVDVVRLRSDNENIYRITIYKNRRSVSGFAKYDSGNMLYEPVSGNDVIVCGINAVKDFLTEGEKQYIELFPALPDEWDGETLLRSIPYSSVGKRHGCMPGIVLDRVCISKGKRKMTFKCCYLAISDNSISVNKNYDFLLNCKMKL